MQSWVYRQGLEKGLKEGLEKELRLLERLFERRLGRSLSETERRTVTQRFGTLGAERLGDVAIESSADTLAVWLNEPNAC